MTVELREARSFLKPGRSRLQEHDFSASNVRHWTQLKVAIRSPQIPSVAALKGYDVRNSVPNATVFSIPPVPVRRAFRTESDQPFDLDVEQGRHRIDEPRWTCEAPPVLQNWVRRRPIVLDV